jgi:hypothetical protein
MKLEYAIMEWLWDVGSLRVNLPGNKEELSTGMYAEVVVLLSKLGKDGWEVCSCVSGSNWLFWTLKRNSTGGPSEDR